jgi:hypothetical protein
MVEAAASVRLRQYESEYSASHLTWHDFADEVREVLSAGEPAARKLLAEQYDAGYKFALSRVRESIEGLDTEVDHALDELSIP